MDTHAIYRKVTANIIAALEAGTIPWAQPYATGLQRNALTLRPYSGINVWVTMWAGLVNKYQSAGWLTFNQAKDAGLHVNKGERSTAILFMHKTELKKEGDEPRFIARYYSVFNLDQLGGDAAKLETLKRRSLGAANVHAPVATCEATVAATGADIRHSVSLSPAYLELMDWIEMPTRAQFTSSETYYATLFHELVHWTGHKTRLNRLIAARFGDENYAAEELVAELGAAFLSHRHGINTVSRSAAYLKNWLKGIRANPSVLVGSASAASAAAEFILPMDATEEVTA